MRSGSIAAAAGFGLLALVAQAGHAAAAELKVMARNSAAATGSVSTRTAAWR